MVRLSLCLLLTCLAASAACSDRAETAASTPAAAPVQHLAPENVAVAEVTELSSGPMVSGQLTPAREATMRAQVGGSIVTLAVDRGQPVQEGAVVARISSRDLEATMASADAAVRSAETALTVATNEQQRTEVLVKGGALASRDLEQARNAVANADANLAAARARQRSAKQLLDDTTLRAPFSGLVSDRPASVGDVVTSGTAILTIVDPSSLRLEALVPSDQIAQVKPGARVTFTIRGQPGRTFTGRVERLGATADPVTRQVPIFVTLPNTGGAVIAGLFAEGRVEAATRKGIVVPLSAVDETGPVPTVTRIRDGKAERVSVELGLRQGELERVEIVKGLNSGDVVITGSAKGIAPGTAVTVVGRS